MKNVNRISLVILLLMIVFAVGVNAAEVPQIDPDVDLAFREAYAEGRDYGPEELTLEYFGEYDGCHVAFVNGPFGHPSDEDTEWIAGYEFAYSSGQRLRVYRDGSILSLKGAYNERWLSDESIGRLWNCYTNGVYEPNPKTGDLITPVVLTMLCAAGCLWYIRRKVG